MPQAGLVCRDDGTSEVLFQRIEDPHAAEPSAGDQYAIRFLRAGRAHLLVKRLYLLLESHSLPVQFAR